jgi:hypothetical protein
MIGVESWEKRGAQLVRYLGKEVNGELQMGAVSGLADMHAREADRVLLAALPALTEQNRKLALDALVSRESAINLLHGIQSGRILKTWLSDKQSTELFRHSDAKVQQLAKESLK